MESEFDFESWAVRERLDVMTVSALRRENLTRPELLVMLGNTEADILQLGLDVGHRLRLKAGIAALKSLHSPDGSTYGEIGEYGMFAPKEEEDDYLTPQPVTPARTRRKSIGDRYMDALIWKRSSGGRRQSEPAIPVYKEVPVRRKAVVAPPGFNRENAEQLLRSEGRNRAFIIRQSAAGIDAYAITMLYNNQVLNFAVERRGLGKYYIGQHEYPDLTSIVTYYSDHPITRVGDYEVCLGDQIFIK